MLQNFLLKFEYHWSFMRNIEYCLMLHNFLINFISICLILHFAFFAWVPQLFVSSNSVNKQTIINFNLICIWYWLAPVGRIMGHKKIQLLMINVVLHYASFSFSGLTNNISWFELFMTIHNSRKYKNSSEFD